MNWANANTWANNLNVNGVTGWRLPDVKPVNGINFTSLDATDFWTGARDASLNISAPGSAHPGTTASEMAHLYYNTLGNLSSRDTAGNDQAGAGLTNTGPFDNLQPSLYWSRVESDNNNIAWSFVFDNGFQGERNAFAILYALAVHPGDVAAVPVPATVWLVSTGLLGMAGFRRKRDISAHP